MSVYTSKTAEEMAAETKAYQEAWVIVDNYSNNKSVMAEIIKNLILKVEAAKEIN